MRLNQKLLFVAVMLLVAFMLSMMYVIVHQIGWLAGIESCENIAQEIIDDFNL